MKTILTGHSRGLGDALARDLLGRGHLLLGLGRSGNAALAGDFPERLREQRLDLSDLTALRDWLAGGQLHDFLADADQAVLINNAGLLQPVGPLGTQGGDAIAQALSVNLGAPLILADAFVAATAHCTDRRIVHISSGAARNAYAGWSIYGATKAGLDQHARAAALEHLPGLRIASLAPGVVDTDMQAQVRASDTAHFPQQARFAALKADGQLTAPAAAAGRLADHLLGERFGQCVDGDLRTL
ncbi:MAG: SDR family oxidoreductase [Zoogloea sp.]|nr:MAG: SDR family oxidoreductase [Zoogloea sp.]